MMAIRISSPWSRLFASRRRAPSGSDGEARFARLVTPHVDAAWTYARHLCRDHAVAEDVVQDALLRAFRAIDTCRGDGKAWLLTIVRHCWHDWLRRSGPQGALAPDPATDTEPIDPATPHTLLEQKHEAMTVHAALSHLTEPCREVVILREWEGLSYRAIADLTGVPIGTVMSRLARARVQLAQTLRLNTDGAAQ